MKRKVFIWLALLLVALAILRSAIATRLDGFTMDEAYHIAAGASYLRFGDFRLNPEHPPLVKLWVGTVMAVTSFHLDPLRRFSDKLDERVFTERIVFRENDPDSVQRRARAAMYALNGLLLLFLAFALERTFNAGVSLGTLLFLAIDPTVAARAYIEALKYAPDEPGIRSALQYQIQRASRDALAGISPLRDPNLE
jgi:hypothetical protein